MNRRLAARSRVLTVLLCFAGALGAGAGGCGAAGSNAVTVTGKTLTVYLSAPANLQSNPQAQDVIDAELLAFNSSCTLQSCPPIHVGSFKVDLVRLTGNKISSNARRAIIDSTAVAYLGEVQPGSSIDSLGITNAQDLLQVSPAPEATVPQKDFESYSSYSRTFASIAQGENAQSLLSGSAAKTFQTDFRNAYHHSPSANAIFGYMATSAVLKALGKAGSAANNRSTVRSDFFALKNAPILVGQSGPQLGTFTVGSNGTITVTP